MLCPCVLFMLVCSCSFVVHALFMLACSCSMFMVFICTVGGFLFVGLSHAFVCCHVVFCVRFAFLFVLVCMRFGFLFYLMFFPFHVLASCYLLVFMLYLLVIMLLTCVHTSSIVCFVFLACPDCCFFLLLSVILSSDLHLAPSYVYSYTGIGQ